MVAWTVGLDHVHVVAQVIGLVLAVAQVVVFDHVVAQVTVLVRVRTHRALIRGIIRRCKLGFVRLDHIRDVAKEVGARLPRIFLRMEADPSYLIPTRVWDIVSEVTMTSGDARGILVGNNAFSDPVDISRSVNNRRGGASRR
ncbi:hypothetical protein PI124_g22581 [Phytophthora idaei]|nr:hypothetical protein PI124_g22581 [Phytophthora idaei]